MDSILKLSRFQLIADKYISIVAVGHDTLQFRITQEVCKYLTAAGAILIEENSRFLSLVDQYPDVTLFVVVIFAHLAPGLIAVHYRVLFQGYGFQYENQFIKVFLAFLKPVA